MNHAADAVTSLNPDPVKVGDVVGESAQRRGLLQGSVRPVGVVEVSYSRSTVIRCRWFHSFGAPGWRGHGVMGRLRDRAGTRRIVAGL